MCGFTDLKWNGKQYFCSKCGRKFNKIWEEQAKASASLSEVKFLERLKTNRGRR